MSKFLTAWLNEETGEIHSPKCIVVYPAFLEPKVNRKFPDKPPKFNGIFLIPKGAEIKAMSDEIGRAALDKHGAQWKAKIKVDKYPIQKTAGHGTLSEFADKFPLYLSASANADFPPFIFGPDAKPFKGNASEIYSGRWCVIAGNAWGYDTGSNGVGWNLNRVQLLDHGDPIAGGRVSTNSGFETVEVAPGSSNTATKAKTSDDVMGDAKSDPDDDLPF